MIRYPVFLEVDDEGRTMAHVLDLPGCMARGPSREQALERVPGAIRDTWAWLRRHGEPAPVQGEELVLEVVGEFRGTGPFDPGDAAALYPPEREPITPEEMEEAFRYMSHARAELAALAEGVTEDLLDWRPFPGHYNLRRILRHIGNADQWYVSRIVPPETLPPEWADDEEMPLPEFLEMARRTAVERLRLLTEAQRAGVFYPTEWTSHPEEPWTARKVLRRALEHEREHTAQVREVLAARRRWLLARLAAERAGLLASLLGLDGQQLTAPQVLNGWSVNDMLAHIAAWDRWEECTMRAMVAGEEPDFAALHDVDAANEAFVAERRAQTPAAALAELQTARSSWQAWLESLSEEEFFRPRSYHGYDWTFASVPLRVQEQHDREHAEQVTAWHQSSGLARGVGPRSTLLAALAGAREELLAAAALVPRGERSRHPVCGEWTAQDVLGHVADWERFGAQGVHLMVAGEPPDVEPVLDLDAWNAAHVQARREQSWEIVWEDLEAARSSLLSGIGQLDEADLRRMFSFPWGGRGTPYDWVCVYIEHDRSHARDLRAAVGLSR